MAITKFFAAWLFYVKRKSRILDARKDFKRLKTWLRVSDWFRLCYPSNHPFIVDARASRHSQDSTEGSLKDQRRELQVVVTQAALTCHWHKSSLLIRSYICFLVCDVDSDDLSSVDPSIVKEETLDVTISDQPLLELPGYTPEFRCEMSLFWVHGILFGAIRILTMSSAFQAGLFCKDMQCLHAIALSLTAICGVFIPADPTLRLSRSSMIGRCYFWVCKMKPDLHIFSHKSRCQPCAQWISLHWPAIRYGRGIHW